MEKENPANTEELELTHDTPPPNTTHEQAVTTHTPPPNTTVEQALTPVTPPPNTTDEQALSPVTPLQLLTIMEKENPVNTEEQELTPHKPPPTTTEEQLLTPDTTTDEQAVTTHTSSPNTTDEQLRPTPDTPPPNTTFEQPPTPDTPRPKSTDEQALTPVTLPPNTTDEQALNPDTPPPTTTDEHFLTPDTPPPATTTDEQVVTTHTSSPDTTDEQALTPDAPPPATTTDEQAVTTHTSSPDTTDEQALTPDTPSPNTTVEQALTPVTLPPNTTDEQALNPDTPAPNTTDDEQAVTAHASSSNTTGEQALTTINTLSIAMFDEQALGHSTDSDYAVKQAISRRILAGRVIVEVCTLEQAKTAESAGARCVCVTPLPPPSTGISYMPDPSLVQEIKRQLSIPVMARVRVGHSVEAQILETLGIDFIDESETLGITDGSNFINKKNFKTPFVSGCCDLGQALNRFQEGASLLRCQGSRRNLAETVKSVRKVIGDFKTLITTDEDELSAFAERIEAPYDVVARANLMGTLPVLLLASGGIETPADAALMMSLGCNGVFIGVEVFRYGGAAYEKLRSIIRAAGEYKNIHVVAEASHGFGDGGGLQEDS